jgi:hypothetical protein
MNEKKTSTKDKNKRKGGLDAKTVYHVVKNGRIYFLKLLVSFDKRPSKN